MHDPIRRVDILRDLQVEMLSQALRSEHQLAEVMVDFWFNHFNVSGYKGQVHFVLGDYVHNVIRTHALGRFEDMLVAVAQHPAMLLYLDNSSSSVVRPGPRGDRGGINENFARELLELHTVGVDGGYTQRDVEEVARILSGWTVRDLGFAYLDGLHDAGEKTVMGTRYPAGRGLAEGVDLLRALARHPRTAEHISRKLLERFVSDAPPPEYVARVAAEFRASGGDIPRSSARSCSIPDSSRLSTEGRK